MPTKHESRPVKKADPKRAAKKQQKTGAAKKQQQNRCSMYEAEYIAREKTTRVAAETFGWHLLNVVIVYNGLCLIFVLFTVFLFVLCQYYVFEPLTVVV